MGVIDAKLQITGGTALSAGGGTGAYVYPDSIDLDVAREIGPGEPLEVVFQVTTLAENGTNVVFEVVTDPTAVDGSSAVVARSPVIVTADLTAGARFSIPIPAHSMTAMSRYLGARVQRSGTYTAGVVRVWVAPSPVAAEQRAS